LRVKQRWIWRTEASMMEPSTNLHRPTVLVPVPATAAVAVAERASLVDPD
jgi:hypothetical protein